MRLGVAGADTALSAGLDVGDAAIVLGVDLGGVGVEDLVAGVCEVFLLAP